ncbi:Transcriptional regulator WAR1 [Cytospora mali]|uniref:Transcriptional regulator WAR1 n=1 Tax=Cytospora mali TaxID=578113 RepID=A0A194UTN5_CYTMA|nr:Transcriptional regulator WAR1 [Valsa mali var. pyri (nom. inval.)]
MSLLNASQQISQNSPSSSGQTPPGSASGPVPSHEPNRNSIHQLLNPNVEPSTASVASNRTSDIPDATSTPPTSNNYHYNARLIPSAGLAPPSSMAAGPSTGTSSPRLPPDTPGSTFRGATRPPAPTSADAVEIIPGFTMTFYEADRALNLYRSLYAPCFPFVTVPVMVTPYELFEKAPFLFRTIVSVTTPQSPAIQADFKIWFRHYIAEHVVVNNERRLEHLQALLVHIAWGDFHFFMDSQATNLIQLAVALVIDLGLNRWPLDFGRASFLMLKEAAVHNGLKKHLDRKHSLDELRASLGTFYVTSLLSTFFRRHNPLYYGSYLDKCREEIEQAQEYDSDKFLVALVRIQQLLSRAAELIPYGDDEASRRVNYAPIHMALTSIRKELDALIRDQPPEVECNALFWTHYHGTICRLFEPVIYIRSISRASGYDAAESNARTSALWTCLTAARDFFSAFMVIPPQNLLCTPFHSAHLSFMLVTASRLLFLGDETMSSSSTRDPDWNVVVARDNLNFEAICLRLVEYYDEADRMMTNLGRRGRYVENDKNVLCLFRDKVGWIRNWYLGRTRPSAAETFPGAYAQDPRGRGPSNSGTPVPPKDGTGTDTLGTNAPGGGHVGGLAGGSNVPTAQGGQAMDLDLGGLHGQLMMPGELDDSFWQAMLDMNGGMGWMDVQA